MVFALGARALAAGYRLAAYDTIGSTSTEAAAWATLGDPGRLWVVANEQTAGHGRRGRAWQTPRGNLAASLLLVDPHGRTAPATLGFAAGLALEGAISNTAGNLLPLWEKVPVSSGLTRGSARLADGREVASGLRLKWPNDVLFDGAKIAGILLEAASGPRGTSSVVVGIGVNVRHAPAGVPYPVTSLAGRGADIAAETLFSALSDAWVEVESLWDEGRGFPCIRDRWLTRAAGLGAPIAVKLGNDTLLGTFETIDDEGRLILRAGDGSARAVSAGEVNFGSAATAER